MKTLRNTLVKLVEKQKKVLDKISVIQMEIKTLSATMEPASIKKAAVIAGKLDPLHSEHSKIKQEIELTRTKLVAKRNRNRKQTNRRLQKESRSIWTVI